MLFLSRSRGLTAIYIIFDVAPLEYRSHGRKCFRGGTLYPWRHYTVLQATVKMEALHIADVAYTSMVGWLKDWEQRASNW